MRRHRRHRALNKARPDMISALSGGSSNWLRFFQPISVRPPVFVESTLHSTGQSPAVRAHRQRPADERTSCTTCPRQLDSRHAPTAPAHAPRIDDHGASTRRAWSRRRSRALRGLEAGDLAVLHSRHRAHARRSLARFAVLTIGIARFRLIGRDLEIVRWQNRAQALDIVRRHEQLGMPMRWCMATLARRCLT